MHEHESPQHAVDTAPARHSAGWLICNQWLESVGAPAIQMRLRNQNQQAHDRHACSFDAGDYPSVQQLSPAASGSRFYEHFSEQLRQDVAQQPITMQNHHFGEFAL